MNRSIGIIGLGKMGGGIARHLMEKGWDVTGFDPSSEVIGQLSGEGMKTADSPQALVQQLPSPRVIWLMVPAGKAVEETLFGTNGIAEKLSGGDIVIDGGNSFYKDSIERAKKLSSMGTIFVDVGFSGGPEGGRHGGCLMVGGDEATFKNLEPLFRDLAVENGCQFFVGAGAGHFVKMVHNGIEYGIMQSLAEGFAILKASPFQLDLTRVADIYNHGSVIESRLVGWLEKAFTEYGEELTDISGSVAHSGEGEWTAATAKELDIPAKVIEESVTFRIESAQKPSFTGKIVSALRAQFGGHRVKE